MVHSNDICICQVCTCGRHHCAHRPKTAKKTPCQLGRSTHAEDFPAYVLTEKPRSFKPPVNRGEPGAFEGRSSYEKDYPKKEAPKIQRKEPAKYQPNNLPFLGNSTASKDFVPHNVPRQQPIRPKERVREAAPMEFSTTQGDAMQAWTPQKAVSFKPKNEHKPPPPLNGSSTYLKEFPVHKVDRTMPIKPKQATVGEKAPMEKLSTAQRDFPGVMVPKAESMRPKNTRKEPPPFVGGTTAQKDFKVPDNYERARSFKPQNAPVQSGKFDGDSTVNRDFPAWPVQKREPRPKEEYQKPKVPFEGRSMARDSFQHRPQSRRQPIKPVAAPVATGPGDYNTNYNSNMKTWTGRPSTSFKPKQEYIPGGKFNDETETRRNFVHAPAEKAKNFKPEAKYRPSSGFTGPTGYRADYVPKELGCPALRYPKQMWQESGCDITHPHTHANGTVKYVDTH